MPDCTAETLESNCVTLGYLSLGDVALLQCACATLSAQLANLTATAALLTATNAGYNYLGDLDLDEAILDRKSTRLNSSHIQKSRMPSSA